MLEPRKLTKQRQFSELATEKCCESLIQCASLESLEIERCIYMKPHQVIDLIHLLPKLKKLFFTPKWVRDLGMWKTIYELMSEIIEFGNDFLHIYYKICDYNTSHFMMMYDTAPDWAAQDVIVDSDSNSSGTLVYSSESDISVSISDCSTQVYMSDRCVSD